MLLTIWITESYG